jgi:hypothetical protein
MALQSLAFPLDPIEGDARYRWAANRARESRGTAKAWIARVEGGARRNETPGA